RRGRSRAGTGSAATRSSRRGPRRGGAHHLPAARSFALTALSVPTVLDLLDWKRRIFDLYANVRRDADHQAAWDMWRRERDELFATHPQSPIPPPDRSSFSGLPYFEYDPASRVLAEVRSATAESYDLATSG